jgi:hypothetical protein
VLSACLSAVRCTFTGAPKPIREAMAQTEASWRQAFVISGADGAAILNVGCVHIGRQRRNQWMEYVSGEGDERREIGICGRERHLKA